MKKITIGIIAAAMLLLGTMINAEDAAPTPAPTPAPVVTVAPEEAPTPEPTTAPVVETPAPMVAAPAPAKAPVLTAIEVRLLNADCQACIDALATELNKNVGVSDAKATLTPAKVTANLDEATISASEFINKLITLDDYDARLALYIDSAMCKGAEKMCDGCFTEIPLQLKKVEGVIEVTLDNTGRRAKITFTEKAVVKTADLAAALAKSEYGFTVSFTAPKE